MSLARLVEVELKYRVAGEEVGNRILGDDRLGELRALGAVREAHHQDRYFDTQTRALETAGYAARLRETDEGRALHRREEHEAPATADLDPGRWPPSDARSLVLDLAGRAQLKELVRIRQTRRRRDFGDPATTVEVSLDDVEKVRGDAVVDQFRELEVELISGPEAGLEGLSELLGGIEGLTASRASKLDIALAAIAASGSAPEVAAATEPMSRVELPKNAGVRAEDSLADAGRKVLRFHLARMVAREKGTRSGKDPEDLHAMRVATRRMRAAWRVFGQAYRPKRTRRIQRSLKAIAADLGAVRDLDVLIEGGEGYANGLATPEPAALETLFDRWRRQRDADRDVIVRELDGEAYRRLVEDLAAFVEERTEAKPIDTRLPHLVRDTAPALIWSAYHAVRAYEPVLRWADIETLHALRIDAKRLRYSLEFFRETLGPEAGDLIERTVTLQDHLGLLHDADVAAHLAREFLVDRATDLGVGELAAIGRYLLHCEHEVRRLSRAVGRPWRRIQGITFRRRLGRVLAGL